jgi:hypothetical protein
MKQIEDATKGMGNAQKLQTLSTIFGARAVNAMNVILEKGVDNVADFRSELEKAAGSSKKMSDTIRQSLGNRLLILRSALIELGFKFIEAFAGKAGEGVDAAIKAVQRFDVKPVVEGLKDVISFSKELFETLRPFLRWLPEMVGLWAAYRLALVAVTTVQAIVFFVKLASGIKAAVAAQGALNLVMLANPLALVTAAVFALIVALGILVTNYDEVVSGWEAMFINIEIFGRTAINGLKLLLQGFINFHIAALEMLINAGVKAANFFGADLGEVSLGRIDLGADFAGIRDAEARLKALREESAGLGVGRGAAGIRGGGFVPRPGAKAGPMTDAAAQFERQLAADLAIPETQFGPAEAAAQIVAQQDRASAEMVKLLLGEAGGLQAPNQAEAEARIAFEGRISFENAPEGMSFETETTGAPPVAVEGLGGQ